MLVMFAFNTISMTDRSVKYKQPRERRVSHYEDGG